MRVSTFILLAFALLMVGCVAPDLRMTNRAGTGINIYSEHPQKVTTIAAGATAAVPHTSGCVVIITERNEVWEYDDVRWLVDGATGSAKSDSLQVNIGRDGSLMSPSGRVLIPSRKLGGK